MKDTLQIIKGLGSDPVPYVNTTVLFGLAAMEWDLLIKILIGFGSVVWTYLKVYNEWKKVKDGKNETLSDTTDK
jgi:hypothetical protein